MQVLTLEHVRIDGIATCLPARSVDNLARCRALYGEEKKAVSVVKGTGITACRVAEPGTSSLDLCLRAARDVLTGTGTRPDEIGAVIDVTFTPERLMPCDACQAQGRLGLPKDVVAFDMGLACSGWAFGLYTAAQYVRATGKKVLLLDGDAQTARTDPTDQAVVPVLADAGTATVLSPCDSASSWSFSFLSDGAKGEVLSLPLDGNIRMDGFEVFKFVTVDVLQFIREFMTRTGLTPENVDAFVPHQANVFMIQQIAKKLGFAEKLWVSGDVFGNSASATVPTTIAHCAPSRMKGGAGPLRLLISGFGGGLSASVGVVEIGESAYLGVVEL